MKKLRSGVIAVVCGSLLGLVLVFSLDATAWQRRVANIPWVMDSMILGGSPLDALRRMTSGSLKVWATGEVLKASDLNANFSAIDSNYVGGKGARLVDSDVTTTAAISHIKLANPGVFPKGIIAVLTACTSNGSCLITFQEGVNTAGQATSPFFASVTRTGAGLYTVAFTTARADVNYAVICTTLSVSPSGTCGFSANLVGSFGINTQNAAGAATDEPFVLSFYDDEN